MKSISQGRDTRTSRSVNMLDFSLIFFLFFFLRNGGTNTCKSAWRSSSSHSVDTRRSESTNSANHLFYLFFSIYLDPDYGFNRESCAFSLSLCSAPFGLVSSKVEVWRTLSKQGRLQMQSSFSNNWNCFKTGISKYFSVLNLTYTSFTSS